MRRLIFVLVPLFAIACAGLLYLALSWRHDGSGEAVVEIRRGASIRGVAKTLQAQDVIANAALFELAARLKGERGTIRAGEFLLPRDLSIRGVVARLNEGSPILHPVTIREGLTIGQTGAALEKSGTVTADAFRNAVEALAKKRARRIPTKSLEGYLFPETYHFRKGVSALEVAEAMLDTFHAKVAAALPKKVMNDSAALHRIVTLASIIEKETGAGHERRLISAVFTNRLKKRMLLQSDPTVIYALPSFDGNLRKRDLLYDSPYNTYVYPGLPPGPIASPGLASIEAAWRPADVDHLYFVSKNNGEHHFSKTLKEHNRAVRRYQITRRNR